MQTLMERLDSQAKRKLSLILGVPTSMEEAAERFSNWTGMGVTPAEVGDYFQALQAKLDVQWAAATRNDNDWQIRSLKARMWWRLPVLESAIAQPAPQPSYVPQPEESPLRVQVTQLTEELAYYKGFAAAARLFAQPTPKGAQ